jgi:micrococcal nuclease
MWEYQAKVTRVIDADTLEIQIDVGFSIYTEQDIRILGLNSPERNTPAGKAAIAFATGLFFVELTPRIVIKTEYDRSFTRYLGDVTLSDGRDYAAVIKEAGHGV